MWWNAAISANVLVSLERTENMAVEKAAFTEARSLADCAALLAVSGMWNGLPMGEGRLQFHWCSHQGSDGWYVLISWICVLLVSCEMTAAPSMGGWP
jgi:hypothetical protein